MKDDFSPTEKGDTFQNQLRVLEKLDRLRTALARAESNARLMRVALGLCANRGDVQ